MAAPGITVIKSFTYRGSEEEYSNTYHFVGSAPSDDVGWRSLADDLITLEHYIYDAETSVVRALCYEDTDDDSVYTYHLADFGGPVSGALLVGGDDIPCPGDAAVWCAWDTGKRSTKGKPIWLRKYFHPAYRDSGDDDTISATQKADLVSFATSALSASGDWPGIADKDGDAPTGSTRVADYVTTRTLKRRGRRPT